MVRSILFGLGLLLLPPFAAGQYTGATALQRKYATHPEAIAWGWFAGASPGSRALVYAAGNSWGPYPLTAMPSTVNVMSRVSAVADEFRANGWDVWYVGYPPVPGSYSATIAQGQPQSWTGITARMGEALSYFYTRVGYLDVVAMGSSASGVSWARVASDAANTPSAVVLIDTAPTLGALDASAQFIGAPAYVTGSPTISWPAVPFASKLPPSPLPDLATGSGSSVPVVAVYASSTTIAGSWSDYPSFVGAYGGLFQPIPGYANPHDIAGGALLDYWLAQRGPADGAYRVEWGDPSAITGHPTGLGGLSNPGNDPAWAAGLRAWVEAAIVP